MDRPHAPESSELSSGTVWHRRADQILKGDRLTADDGLAILQSDDRELLDLLSAAYRIRYARFGNRVHLNFLINAQSGHCSENCGYCSQSNVSQADIPTYGLLASEEVFEGARIAADRQAQTYCIVLSGRGPSPRAMDQLSQIVPRIKAQYGLKICASLGLLTPQQAEQLKACGVDRVNHNLNTSERFYSQICTTHTYQDRLDTLRAVRAAGLEICCGGIVGMGEEDADVVELALRLSELEAEAIPINFLLPIAGIALTPSARLNPRYCLKVLALFRMANPRCELRIAGGREIHLGPLQPLGLFAANSIFVGDYLTTKGQPPEEDYRMIEALGFEPVVEASSAPHPAATRLETEPEMR
jgi:biotin synthase